MSSQPQPRNGPGRLMPDSAPQSVPNIRGETSNRPVRLQRVQPARDIHVAKHNLQRTKKQPSSKGTGSSRPKTPSSTGSGGSNKNAKKKTGIAQFLTPQAIQDSIKTMNNLRGHVKTWVQYLQQADRMLETLYVTSNSLKESGVLDKLVKSKGKNLTTDDFTNVLIALMNSPIGSSVFKAMGSKSDDEEAEKPANPTG